MSGWASGISYHPNGAVAGYTLANGITHSLTQNTRGLPLVNRDAGVLQDQYSYDANGNVTGIADQQEGVFSRSMGYDELDRLTSASAPNVWGSATYAYDPVDNLRAATVGTRSSSFNIDAGSNQLASVTTNGATANYGFDARGNLLTKGGQSFSFDLGNRLSWSSLGGSYAYDGLGRRIKIVSSDGSTRLQVYSQQGQLLWATSSGGPRPASVMAYIYLGGKLIADSNSISGRQYVHTDALGSPVAHTNASGGLINRSRFEPYGYVAQGTKPSAATSAIGFTGHVQDAETDLVYMQQRYYDPIAGRFLSVDPVMTNANSGRSFGRYHYADNSPYVYVDPDGRDTECPPGDDGKPKCPPVSVSGTKKKETTFTVLVEGTKDYARGFGSYYRGLWRVSVHLYRRSGASGECRQERAIQNETALGAGVLSMSNPDVAKRALSEAGKWAGSHKAYLAGRGTAGTATGAATGLGIYGGIGLGLLAASGDALHNIDRADAKSAEQVLRSVLGDNMPELPAIDRPPCED